MNVRSALTALVCLSALTLPPSLRAQDVGPEVLRIGVSDAPQEEVFGRIADVAVDTAGRIYVLDELNFDLRVFAADGRFIARTGRFGGGPGEFREKLRGFVDGTGAIHVSDGGNVRISSFRLEGDSLVLEHDVRTESFPMESCGQLGRRWILQRGADRHLVHEIGDAGEVLARLMPREAPPGELAELFGDQVHLFYNSLSMACAEDAEAVVLMHHGQPIVRANHISGPEIWRAELPGFVQGGYRRTPDGGCCYAGIPDPETGTYSMAWAIVSDGEGRLFASYSEYTKATLEHRYRTAVLDARSGERLGVFDAPGIVQAVRDGRVYVVTEDPHPTVSVHLLVGR